MWHLVLFSVPNWRKVILSSGVWPMTAGTGTMPGNCHLPSKGTARQNVAGTPDCRMWMTSRKDSMIDNRHIFSPPPWSICTWHSPMILSCHWINGSSIQSDIHCPFVDRMMLTKIVKSDDSEPILPVPRRSTAKSPTSPNTGGSPTRTMMTISRLWI